MKDKDTELLWEAYMAEKKKPDADGDGVPDWVDKKPGEDDHEEDRPTNDRSSDEKEPEETIGGQGVEETNSGNIKTALKDDEDSEHYEKTGEIRKKKKDEDPKDKEGVEDSYTPGRDPSNKAIPFPDGRGQMDPSVQNDVDGWEDARFYDLAMQFEKQLQSTDEYMKVKKYMYITLQKAGKEPIPQHTDDT